MRLVLQGRLNNVQEKRIVRAASAVSASRVRPVRCVVVMSAPHYCAVGEKQGDCQTVYCKIDQLLQSVYCKVDQLLHSLCTEKSTSNCAVSARQGRPVIAHSVYCKVDQLLHRQCTARPISYCTFGTRQGRPATAQPVY